MTGRPPNIAFGVLTRDEVLALVAERPGITSPEVAEATGSTIKSVVNHLERLHGEGRIMRFDAPRGSRAKYAWVASGASATDLEAPTPVIVQLQVRRQRLLDQSALIAQELEVLEEALERLTDVASRHAATCLRVKP